MLETDVEVLGETFRSHTTTIEGGWLPFFGVAPTRTRIEGIHFESPLLSAVILIRSTLNNVLVGRSGTVIDLGTGNQITGLGKMGHGEHLGQQIRDAQARRHEAIRRVLDW